MWKAAADKRVTVIIALNLSAAFDTVGRETLLECRQTKFGVLGMSVTWIHSATSMRHCGYI